LHLLACRLHYELRLLLLLLELLVLVLLVLLLAEDHGA
jgi:hypothetical protein